ncbi:unnamed protein product [Closterium sp. Naga37s-1]|nr:unnamed protein product [Closterium sp. Naga37s-1]
MASAGRNTLTSSGSGKIEQANLVAVRFEFKIHLVELRGWLRASPPLIIRWQRGDSRAGLSAPVWPPADAPLVPLHHTFRVRCGRRGSGRDTGGRGTSVGAVWGRVALGSHTCAPHSATNPSPPSPTLHAPSISPTFHLPHLPSPPPSISPTFQFKFKFSVHSHSPSLPPPLPSPFFSPSLNRPLLIPLLTLPSPPSSPPFPHTIPHLSPPFPPILPVPHSFPLFPPFPPSFPFFPSFPPLFPLFPPLSPIIPVTLYRERGAPTAPYLRKAATFTLHHALPAAAAHPSHPPHAPSEPAFQAGPEPLGRAQLDLAELADCDGVVERRLKVAPGPAMLADVAAAERPAGAVLVVSVECVGKKLSREAAAEEAHIERVGVGWGVDDSIGEAVGLGEGEWMRWVEGWENIEW